MGKKVKKQLVEMQDVMVKVAKKEFDDVPEVLEDDFVLAWRCVDIGVSAARALLEDGCDVDDVVGDMSKLVNSRVAEHGILKLADVIRDGVE